MFRSRKIIIGAFVCGIFDMIFDRIREDMVNVGRLFSVGLRGLCTSRYLAVHMKKSTEKHEIPSAKRSGGRLEKRE